MKCLRCCLEKLFDDHGWPQICFKCYEDFEKEEVVVLSCEERGHSNHCKCPGRASSNTYISPTVTAVDFPEPGKTVEEFLASVSNEKDRAKLKEFFEKKK